MTLALACALTLRLTQSPLGTHEIRLINFNTDSAFRTPSGSSVPANCGLEIVFADLTGDGAMRRSYQ